MMTLKWLKMGRYVVVGILTLVVYLASGAVMQRLGLTIGWLGPLAFIVAVTFNYLLQRAWVFADSRPVAASLAKYGFMITIGCIINSLTLMVLASHMPLVFAQLTAVVLVVVSNAFFSFFFVFAIRREGNLPRDSSN